MQKVDTVTKDFVIFGLAPCGIGNYIFCTNNEIFLRFYSVE
jgi:hypothetical protein